MRRVLVIGSGGAGKSTFAAQLAAIAGLPLIHLDTLYWKPGWIEASREDWSSTIDRLIDQPEWVMDGNYGGTLDRRLEAADTVVFLDVNRFVCLARVVRRRIRHHGRSRPAMTHGCPERLTWEFLRWIWTYPVRRRPDVLERLRRLRPDQRVVVITSASEAESYLAACGPRHAWQ